MSNHVHLLLQEGSEPVSTTVKRFGVRYVGWFNRKYDRVGHLFQDRFVSRPVEDDADLLMVLLYIHFNPVVAGLCAEPADYPWSSRSTLGNPRSLVSLDRLTRLVPLEAILVGEDSRVAEFADQPYEGPAVAAPRRTDAQVWDVLSQLTGAASASDFQRLAPQVQRASLDRLRAAGASVRQLSRLTGLNRNLIWRWGASS
jgi:hypothetical protein